METADSTTHPITRRALLRLALAAPVVSGLIALPTVQTAAQPRPVPPQVRRLQLDGRRMRRIDPDEHQRQMPGRRRSREVYASAAEETEPFTITALTWTGDDRPSDVTLLIRTRERGGDQWSVWIELHDDGHGPDPETPEAHTARHGTDVVIAGESDAIEVRVESPDGDLPDDLRVELIDPGESPADATVAAHQAGVAEAAVAAKPTIRTRADWGADESMRGGPQYGQVRGMFVHHTAGSNTYTQSAVPGIIRGIYAYHVNGRGWRDIGYNFLIDKFGRIWEGRYGGIDRAVIGAHTANYNGNAFGAGVLGTYTSKAPESAVLQAYQQLIAWKFSLHGVNPSVTVTYPGLKTLPPVGGHRNAGATECPGAQLYTRLEAMRSGATALMGYIPRATAALRLEGPSSASAGSRIRLDVRWSAGGWVTGTVTLQRWNGGAWGYVRQINVKNGKASIYVLLDRTRTYRVYGSAPGVQGRTSKDVTVTATS
jgi:hypothetical protein